MNNAQRSLFAIFIPMTILIVYFDNVFPQEKIVNYVRYAIMISLCLVAVSVKKKFKEQKLMAIAFIFLVIADFFLVFSTTIDILKIDIAQFGISGFAVAYICLIIAYNKNAYKIKLVEVVVAIPIVGIFIFVFNTLICYINGIMKIGAIAFALILCYMLLTSICTLFRDYFNKKIAIIIAISGILMFICDVGVAYSLFHPFYSTVYNPLLKNIVWISYIIGWTLLDVVICEETKLYS
jgi:hypothetical protein